MDFVVKINQSLYMECHKNNNFFQMVEKHKNKPLKTQNWVIILIYMIYNQIFLGRGKVYLWGGILKFTKSGWFLQFLVLIEGVEEVDEQNLQMGMGENASHVHLSCCLIPIYEKSKQIGVVTITAWFSNRNSLSQLNATNVIKRIKSCQV